MTIEVLKSKIHRVTVTEARLDYIGSITIDSLLLEAANILPASASTSSTTTTAKGSTHTQSRRAGSGTICLNGAAARLVQPGDIVIIMAYASMTPEEARTFRPAVIFPDTATNLLK